MANPARVEDLVRKITSDPKFSAQLNAAFSQADKKRVLDQAGFGDLKEEDVMAYHRQAAPELSDEQLAAAAGGAGDLPTTTTTATTITGTATAAVAVAG